MRTDIHGVFQRHDAATDTWVDIPSKYEQNRHYQLFAVLAGVRNGYGFAGVPTGEPVKPIAEQRGYPADFKLVELGEDSEGNRTVVGPAAPGDSDEHPISSLECLAEWRRKYYGTDDPMTVWMGDHSHSWLTGQEMLDWVAKSPVALQTGILSRSVYDAWDKKSPPDSYCSGISGPGVIVVNDNLIEMQQTQDWTYVRCHWESALVDELRYFFDEVKRLADEHGDIRFVFGFDS